MRNRSQPVTREICMFRGHDQKVSIDFTELKLIEMKTHVLVAAAVHLWQKKKLPELVEVGGNKLKSLESQWAIVIGYSVYNDAVIFFGFPSAWLARLVGMPFVVRAKMLSWHTFPLHCKYIQCNFYSL